ncbi:MAG: hypothetical protein JWR45_3420 [Blastococcus sp.]|nr:hypothetical protein [Blastococcus sp.]
MPSYRLLAGPRTVLEVFAADQDGEAIERARRLSLEFPCEPQTFAARWGYFRLERQQDHVWHFLFAWVPGDPLPAPPE